MSPDVAPPSTKSSPQWTLSGFGDEDGSSGPAHCGWAARALTALLDSIGVRTA
jgi:hypothetical protein